MCGYFDSGFRLLGSNADGICGDSGARKADRSQPLHIATGRGITVRPLSDVGVQTTSTDQRGFSRRIRFV